MRAREIREYFLSRAKRVDREHTVDTFKHGDGEAEVESVGVTWMLTMDAIDEAERLRVNFVITHEPTFYTHYDDVEEVKADPMYLAKRRRLDDVGLTVLRLHDCWDHWPEIGIGPSLAKLLKLTRLETGGGNVKVYGTEVPTTLDAFARLVREKLGMDAVQVMGDGGAKVERVGLAFGMSGGLVRLRGYVAMKTDVVVAGELINWQDIRYLQDNRCPLILTDHAASENPGMRSLARFVQEQFGVPTHFIEVGCPFRTLMR